MLVRNLHQINIIWKMKAFVALDLPILAVIMFRRLSKQVQ